MRNNQISTNKKTGRNKARGVQAEHQIAVLVSSRNPTCPIAFQLEALDFANF